ncbi:MAG: FkbM family methyltransferase [Roseomonas sp.]|jgi:FkbM family methyltransferase|nr:FkbM family methyltransferase [Roseomonas sp.]
MELSLRGQRVVVSEAHQAFWEVFQAGKWEEATLDTFDRHLNSSTVFLDIGAWIGPTTLYAAGRAKRVIAIEADPVAAGLLRTNIALNPLLAERIEIIERAVSPQGGTLRLGSKGSKGDSMSSVFFGEKENSWEIETITPAEINTKLGDDEPVFLKMDIEGAEYHVLSGIRPLLERREIAALVAFHPTFLPGNKALRWLKSLFMTQKAFLNFAGFTVFRVSKAGIHRPVLLNFLHRCGVVFFSADDTYLFLRIGSQRPA